MPQQPDIITTRERTYILPHPALRGVISHYTLFYPQKQNSPEPSSELRLVPDASGCFVASITENTIDLIFWGPSSRVATVPNGPDSPPLMFFVEFRPAGFYTLLHQPMLPLRDTTGLLQDLNPTLHQALLNLLARSCLPGLPHLSSASRSSSVFPSPSPLSPPFFPGHPIISFLQQLNQIFLTQLSQTTETNFAGHLLQRIHQSHGTLPISTLAKETHYSPRHINRVFSEITGLSPKLLSRIVRINAICQNLNSQPFSLQHPFSNSLLTLAHAFHYHDQAHFIHDFHAVCGLSPTAYIESLSDFYNEDLKFGVIPHK